MSQVVDVRSHRDEPIGKHHPILNVYMYIYIYILYIVYCILYIIIYMLIIHEKQRTSNAYFQSGSEALRFAYIVYIHFKDK